MMKNTLAKAMNSLGSIEQKVKDLASKGKTVPVGNNNSQAPADTRRQERFPLITPHMNNNSQLHHTQYNSAPKESDPLLNDEDVEIDKIIEKKLKQS